MKKCCAIVVTHNADLHLLHQVLSAATSQVEKVYVIDNGSRFPMGRFAEAFSDVEISCFKENRGVAAGFNQGVRYAINAGYQYALLLDQDSIIPDGMIHRYMETMKQLSTSNCLTAALGCRYRNPIMNNIAGFVRFKWFSISYILQDPGSDAIRTDFLISSGSFIDLDVFEKVGFFNEELFIDHIDTEWCHRAASRGYSFFGLWNLIMEHSLGENGLRIWLTRWRFQPIHKPFRLYFIIRNSLLMYRMPHVPLKWISADLFRLLRIFIVYLLYPYNRIESLQYLFKGLIDGMRGVGGRGPL